MSVPFFDVDDDDTDLECYPVPQRIQDAFEQIDRLDRLAPSVLTERQLECWEQMRIDSSAIALAAALSIDPDNARRLRTRVNERLEVAAREEREGKFRVAVTVQHGKSAKFQDDTTATEAINNAFPQAA